MNTAALFQAIQHGNVEARGFCDTQREAELRMSCITSPIAVDVPERASSDRKRYGQPEEDF